MAAWDSRPVVSLPAGCQVGPAVGAVATAAMGGAVAIAEGVAPRTTVAEESGAAFVATVATEGVTVGNCATSIGGTPGPPLTMFRNTSASAPMTTATRAVCARALAPVASLDRAPWPARRPGRRSSTRPATGR